MNSTQITSCLIALGMGVSASESIMRFALDAGNTNAPFYGSSDAVPATASNKGTSIKISQEAIPTPDSQIDLSLADEGNLEEGEQRPSQKAIDDMKTIINEASKNAAFRMGDIASYFGEIGVTWRNNGRMLRLTTFSDDRHPRLDFGTTPIGTLGDYDFDVNATAARLLEKLAWLETQQAMAA
jgi:hypothetical protein